MAGHRGACAIEVPETVGRDRRAAIAGLGRRNEPTFFRRSIDTDRDHDDRIAAWGVMRSPWSAHFSENREHWLSSECAAPPFFARRDLDRGLQCSSSGPASPAMNGSHVRAHA